MKTFLKILFISTIWSQTMAQSLTLNDLLTSLDKNNLDIKALELMVSSNEELLGSYKELPKTSIEIQYGNIQNPFVGDYSFSVSQSFLNPSFYKANKELLTQFKEEKIIQKSLLAAELRRQVKDLYYSYQLNIQNKKLYSKQKNTIENALEIAKLRIEVGENDKLTILNLKMEMFNLNKKFQRLSILNQKIANSIASLCKLHQPVNISEIEYFNLNEFENSIRQNFELKILETSINTKTSEINLEKSKLKPDLKIGLGNQSMLGSIRQFVVLGGIDIPLNKKPQKTRIKAFEIEKSSMLAKYASLEDKINTEKMAILIDIEAKKKEIEKYNSDMEPILNEIEDITLKKYKNSEIDFIVIQNQLLQNFQIKSSVLESIHEYHLLLNQLDFINGN